LFFGIASRVPFAWIVESTRRAFVFRGAQAASPPQDGFAVANVYVSAACREPGIIGTRTAQKSFLKESSRLKKNSAAKFAIARTPSQAREPRALPGACNAALVFFKTGTIENA